MFKEAQKPVSFVCFSICSSIKTSSKSFLMPVLSCQHARYGGYDVWKIHSHCHQAHYLAGHPDMLTKDDCIMWGTLGQIRHRNLGIGEGPLIQLPDQELPRGYGGAALCEMMNVVQDREECRNYAGRELAGGTMALFVNSAVGVWLPCMMSFYQVKGPKSKQTEIIILGLIVSGLWPSPNHWRGNPTGSRINFTLNNLWSWNFLSLLLTLCSLLIHSTGLPAGIFSKLTFITSFFCPEALRYFCFWPKWRNRDLVYQITEVNQMKYLRPQF